jgi:hypothetical protein
MVFPFGMDHGGSRTAGRSVGVGVILRIDAGSGIGRPTYFGRPVPLRLARASTTSWATAQRVAAARLETPILV